MDKPAPTYSLRAATPDDKPRILPLLAELAPHLDPQQRWRWMYDGNPEGDAITWLAIDDASGEIAGVTSDFPIRLWVKGRVTRAAIGGDGYVPPAFRRRGIAAALHKALRAAMPAHGIEVMFGAPAPMNRTPLQQSGSRPIDEMVRFVRPLSASALWRRAGFVDPIARVLLSPRAGKTRLEPVHRGDLRVDEIWAQTRDELTIATVRDARFYGWRFLDAPAQVQHAYVITDDGKPIATCALQERGAHLLIVDLCAPAARWGAAIAAIAREAAGKEAISLALLRSEAKRRQLWREGFFAREGRPYLAVVPEGSPHEALYHDGAGWTYMDSDIDVDRFV